MTALEFIKRKAEEQARNHALITDAQIKAEAIRQRLAAVAEDLRLAATQDGVRSENLLDLANRFEQQSRVGDNV